MKYALRYYDNDQELFFRESSIFGVLLKDSTLYDTVAGLLKGLHIWTHQRTAVFNFPHQIVRVESVMKTFAMRIMNDCEGCADDETVQYAIRHDDDGLIGGIVPNWTNLLSDVKLFDTSRAASQYRDYFDADAKANCNVVRIAVKHVCELAVIGVVN